jgi:hypothetical protein
MRANKTTTNHQSNSSFWKESKTSRDESSRQERLENVENPEER